MNVTLVLTYIVWVLTIFAAGTIQLRSIVFNCAKILVKKGIFVTSSGQHSHIQAHMTILLHDIHHKAEKKS